MIIHRATITNEELGFKTQGANEDMYIALLMATLCYHQAAVLANFEQGTYGATETFTPPTNLAGLMEYWLAMDCTVTFDSNFHND